jgi:hypothetical protein
MSVVLVAVFDIIFDRAIVEANSMTLTLRVCRSWKICASRSTVMDMA